MDSSSATNKRLEGWLYRICSKRIWSKRIWLRKRYFVLEDSNLSCFKSQAASKHEDPIETGLIDSCIRVADLGRESILGRVFFVFTLYNSSNHEDKLKLGARSSEDAARWMQFFRETIMQGEKHHETGVHAHTSRIHSFRSTSKVCTLHERKYSDLLDWAGHLSSPNACSSSSSDVVASNPWRLFGCRNGLRLFQEKIDGESKHKWRNNHQALMAVGVVAASCESVFETIMSLGPSRAEWDFCFLRGKVIEHLDGHSDIIHEQLHTAWFPNREKTAPRDLLIHRYWRREEDGSYVILYHSVTHMKCPPCKGFVRACIKSGGYVISPLNNKSAAPSSIVRHMLAVDWRCLQYYLRPARARNVNLKLLERIAALREMFEAKPEGQNHIDPSLSKDPSHSRAISLDENYLNREMRCHSMKDLSVRDHNGQSSASQNQFLHLSESVDEFFDVPEYVSGESGDNSFDQPLSKDCDLEDFVEDANAGESQATGLSKLSTAAVLVKRLQELTAAAHKQSQVGVEDLSKVDLLSYQGTLPKSSNSNLISTWSMADPSTFLIRGKHYLQDRQKVKAKDTLMQMVAADWVYSGKREDDLAGRPTSFVQKNAAHGGSEFFFVINMQVPGATAYSLALYYMMERPLESVPLLEKFVNGDDAFRNSRFKLIPYISTGSWIVKQSVGKTACMVGQAIEINYFRGANYLEMGLNIGSSTVAKGVVNLVLGYLGKLVIELAFLVQANTEDELPEFLLGTCKLNHLDATKSVSAKQRFG